MKPSRMQRVLAQRAILEKALRGHLVELVHKEQQLQRWLKTVSARAGLKLGFIASLNPGSTAAAAAGDARQALRAAEGLGEWAQVLGGVGPSAA
jgi:hypothetical protein